MNTINNYLIPAAKEITSFSLATALSCGPSQAFGLIKLIVDSCLLLKDSIIYAKIKINCSSFAKSGVAGNPRMTRIVKEKLGLRENQAITDEQLSTYIESKKQRKSEKISRLFRSILADFVAMVPLIGAHLSWRIATNYTGFSYRPFITRSITQAFEHQERILSKMLFPNSIWVSKNLSDDECRVKISVDTSTKHREIDCFLFRAPCNVEGEYTNPTVILCHPMGGTGLKIPNLIDIYLKEGYNVASFTICGYQGSEGAASSEAHIYQDMEAVKKYLSDLGVTQVGYHGRSLGGAVAMQGGAGESNVSLETLFVVADQTFTTAKDVAGNLLGPIGRGAMAAGIPSDRLVELPGGLWTRTDGFDNVNKAKKLAEKNIPLYCIKSDKDFVMGWNKGKDKKYKHNFADILLAQNAEWSGNMIEIEGSHCTCIKTEDKSIFSKIPKNTPLLQEPQ